MSLQHLLKYHAPQGRPRAIPPCDLPAPVALRAEKVAPAPAAPSDGRPVREPGESASRYAARVGHWIDAQDPTRKATRIAKRVATTRKNYLHKKREQAAAVVTETANERWYTYTELAAATGLSYWVARIRSEAHGWPIKRLPRAGSTGGITVAVFGDPATLMKAKRPRHAAPKAKDVLLLAPPVAELITPPRPSLWQRVKAWFA